MSSRYWDVVESMEAYSEGGSSSSLELVPIVSLAVAVLPL